ncbi:MAG: NAD(P)-dependent oxidoreductase [Terriglobia bacterium]
MAYVENRTAAPAPQLVLAPTESPATNPPCAPQHRRDRFRIEPSALNKQRPDVRLHNWDEVFLGFTPEVAMQEASRCLECQHAPCVEACPLGNPIPDAMYLIAQGWFSEAALKFFETSNMPDICGRICPQEKLCEGACVLTPVTEPVRIGKLEAFCVDYLRDRHGYPTPCSAPRTGTRVAVVGAGPAGLTVAEELLKRGHEVTVFDAWPRPGGLLLYGIPNFKLKKEIPLALIERLEQLGARFACGVRIGRCNAVDTLFAQGFHAVFLGHGATAGKQMRIPGEELKKVYQATEYLVRGNVAPDWLPPGLGRKPHAGRRTAVIGGGDTAMDCVRTARRLNPAGEVYCVYRRTEAEMPGRVEERAHARQEGVRFEWLTLPKRLMGNERGEVTAMECARMRLGEPDASGRRRPVEIPGTEFTLAVDTVVLALGYGMDEEIGQTTPELRTTKWGTIWVETEKTAQTSRHDIWAAGDNVRGADLVVTAVAAARKAAQDIDRVLRAHAGRPSP